MLRPVTLALLLGAVGCGKPSPAAPARDLSTAAAPRDLAPPAPTFVPMDVPRFDTHTHIEPGALPRAVQLLGAHKIVEMVNLSGGSPSGDGLEETLDEAKKVGHAVVFVN